MKKVHEHVWPSFFMAQSAATSMIEYLAKSGDTFLEDYREMPNGVRLRLYKMEGKP